MEIKTKNSFTPRGKLDAGDGKIKRELSGGGKPSVTNLVSALIEQAHHLKASDIHLDPGASRFRIRFRIDGVLQDMHDFPLNIKSEIVGRIKILSGLRTDEHQSAQDGRFRIPLSNGQLVDVRVSVVPTYHGENAVLRLLADTAQDFSLKTLGFSAENAKKIAWALRRPYGMILTTGPTGSGKTTTLYTLVKMIHSPDISIITIEDPIEYAMEGVNQIQVNSRTELNFANGLRSVLRQDPNVIMVGEIRDSETASVAVNTALTGHLLLSTLHTNDAATVLPRLLDLKVEPYLIASTVNIVVGQRLVRKICTHCKSPKIIKPADLNGFSAFVSEKVFGRQQGFFYGTGCEYCNFSGYSGRIGIQEVLVPDNTIREAITAKASAGDIRRLASLQGMSTMSEDGFEKAKVGITTVDEVLRILYE